jgi:pimeloyl-ACP methyl ester carboxylesterase
MAEDRAARGTALGYRLIGPSWRSGRPPVVLVHGAHRRIDALGATFAPLAEWLGVPLLLPDFAKPAFAGYQRLAGAHDRLAAADALDALLGQLGWRDRPLDLVGFSGGAQFAHRYALLGSVPIRRAVVAAAGWYTMLDPAIAFPVGVGDGPALQGRQLRVDALLRLPLRIMVGVRDVAADRQLRTGPDVDAQGANRLERARSWHEHLTAEAARRGVACRASFESLPGTGHDLRQAATEGGYVHRVAAFLSDGGPADGSM